MDVVTTYDNVPTCPCCGVCNYVSCGCCPTSPSGLMSDRLTVTPDSPLTWDGEGACGPWAWGYPMVFTYSGTPCVMFGNQTDPPDHEIDLCLTGFFLNCVDGVWYLSVTVQETGASPAHNVVWSLPGFDCCVASQVIALDLVSADPIFTSLPTEITVTNACGCPAACDCPCCPAGYWTEYTFTVAGIADGGTCPRCDDLNGTWTMAYNGSCSWTTATPDDPFCTGVGSYWTLSCFEGTWSLQNHPEGTVYTTEDDLCADGGTLTFADPETGFCDPGSYPATVTVSPSGVFVPCE